MSVADAFTSPQVAGAEQLLQSATDRRINLQRKLDEASDALVAAEEQLQECRVWHKQCATSLAEAQAEEAKLLRSRAQASGITPPASDGAKSITFQFDVESLENFADLEDEAQANLRQMCEEGHRVMLEAQQAFEKKCQDQMQRLKKDIEEAAAKRRKRERPPAAAGGGDPSQEPAAAAAPAPGQQQAPAQPAAAAPEQPAAAAAGSPTGVIGEHAAKAAELGAASAEAARLRASEQRAAGDPWVAPPADGHGAAGQLSG